MRGTLFLLIVNLVLIPYNLWLIRLWWKLAARTDAMRVEASKTNAETKELLASLASHIPPRGES